MSFLSLITVIYFCICLPSIHAQQPYIAKATTDCHNVDPSNSNSVLGYSCNGLNRSCQSYLVFRSISPYNTVDSISSLLGSDPSQLSQINSVSETHTFETNKLVIVPVNCSCSGPYYQANTSYVSVPHDTYLDIANTRYQGLSTCHALMDQNNIPETGLFPGARITVPLRCACPTKNQIDVGVKYLLSYLVIQGDDVWHISNRFYISNTQTILDANRMTTDMIFFPSTLLIPLEKQPSSSETISTPPSSPPPPPPSSPTPPPSSNKAWVYIVVGVCAGTAVLLIIGGIVFCMVHRRRKRKPEPVTESQNFETYGKPYHKKTLDEESQDFLESMSYIGQSIKVYNFKELQSATDDFSPSCLIKGSVYRGIINGDVAAIKKVNGDVSNEIRLLTKFNHSNLIRLSGVCFHGGSWYLVYEFAANGPLSDWIHVNNKEAKFLNWSQRIQIGLDVATGLYYLHSFANPPHVHKNINSSNVMLDSNFRAKIANLALAKAAAGEEGEFALTRHIVGTKGYLAPEYLENGLISTKLDVYAFGVLMLEILTGKEVAALSADEDINLSNVLHGLLNKGHGQESLRRFVDPSMEEKYPLELSVVMIRLIDCCLKKNPSDRPDMDEAVKSLTRILNASLTWDIPKGISSSY